MDPHANVEEAADLARKIVEMEGSLEIRESGKPRRAVWDYADRLAELVLALHEWRESGGFDPYADPDAPVADPQANALLHRVKVNGGSKVFFTPPDATMMAGYVVVVELNPPGDHAFECGIAPDGRVSS